MTRLNVIHSKVGEKDPLPPPSRRAEIQAHFEREWLRNPEQFNPLRNCKERERLKRTMQFVQDQGFRDENKILIADLGCGQGELSRQLADLGEVHAVDIAKNALKNLENAPGSIKTFQARVPFTPLEDDRYDLVISTELIGHLSPQEHRLYFNELARLVKKEGSVVCSSAIDIDSEDALERFSSLVVSEFEINAWQFSYHRLYIKLRRILDFPLVFANAARESRLRSQGLKERRGLKRWWFKLNTSRVGGGFWGLASFILQPLAEWTRQSRSLLLLLEKCSRVLYSELGISHAIFAGSRKPLIQENPTEHPIERKQKRTVWE